MMADVMISSNIPVTGTVDYPTKPEISVKADQTTGLVQKILEISEGFFIGCAGSEVSIRKFIPFLIPNASEKVSLEWIQKNIIRYFELNSGEQHKFDSLILYQDENYLVVMPHGQVFTVHSPVFGEVFAIGTGAPHYIDYVEEVVNPNQQLDLKYENLQQVGLLVTFLANVITRQSLSGFGIAEGWGGAFEAVVTQADQKLKKLDNILFASMFYSVDGNNVKTSQIGNRIFQYYQDNNLIVISQASKEYGKTFVIPNILDGKVRCLVNPALQSIQLLCLTFVDFSTRSQSIKIEYNEFGVEGCYVADFTSLTFQLKISSEKLHGMIRAISKDKGGVLYGKLR